jgi:hypothetical protein
MGAHVAYVVTNEHLDGGAVGGTQKRDRAQAAGLVEDLEGHRPHVQVQPALSTPRCCSDRAAEVLTGASSA